MKVKVKCDICFEIIGTIDTDTIKLPLKASMFLSPDPWHGFDPPFLPGQVWEDFRCPYGRVHRPFIVENRLWLEDGTRLDPARPWAVNPDLPEEMTQRIRPLADVALNDSKETPVEESEEVEELIPLGSYPPATVCHICGKECKHSQALKWHMKSHKKESLIKGGV